MDVLELIKKDHDRVEGLFARFKGGGGLTGLVKRVTGNVSPREKRTAIATICRELDAHAHVEEEVFYPALRATGDDELNRMVDESLREHARLKELVRSLRDGKVEGEELDTQASALEECVQHHVREEENEMLPRTETLVPEARRAELGRRMQQLKRSFTGGSRRTTPRRPSRRRAATPGRQRGRKARPTTARVVRKKRARRRTR